MWVSTMGRGDPWARAREASVPHRTRAARAGEAMTSFFTARMSVARLDGEGGHRDGAQDRLVVEEGDLVVRALERQRVEERQVVLRRGHRQTGVGPQAPLADK